MGGVPGNWAITTGHDTSSIGVPSSMKGWQIQPVRLEAPSGLIRLADLRDPHGRLVSS